MVAFNWEAAIAVTGFMTLGGGVAAFVLRPMPKPCMVNRTVSKQV